MPDTGFVRSFSKKRRGTKNRIRGKRVKRKRINGCVRVSVGIRARKMGWMKNQTPEIEKLLLCLAHTYIHLSPQYPCVLLDRHTHTRSCTHAHSPHHIEHVDLAHICLIGSCVCLARHRAKRKSARRQSNARQRRLAR